MIWVKLHIYFTFSKNFHQILKESTFNRKSAVAFPYGGLWWQAWPLSGNKRVIKRTSRCKGGGGTIPLLLKSHILIPSGWKSVATSTIHYAAGFMIWKWSSAVNLSCDILYHDQYKVFDCFCLFLLFNSV